MPPNPLAPGARRTQCNALPLTGRPGGHSPRHRVSPANLVPGTRSLSVTVALRAATAPLPAAKIRGPARLDPPDAHPLQSLKPSTSNSAIEAVATKARDLDEEEHLELDPRIAAVREALRSRTGELERLSDGI